MRLKGEKIHGARGVLQVRADIGQCFPLLHMETYQTQLNQVISDSHGELYQLLQQRLVFADCGILH